MSNTISLTHKAWIKAILHTKGITTKPHSDLLFAFIAQLGGEAKTIVEIARATETSYGQTHKVVKDLLKAGFLSVTPSSIVVSDSWARVIGKDRLIQFVVEIY